MSQPTKGGRFAKLACCGFVFAVLAVVSWVSVSVLLHQGLAARFIVTSTDNPNFASWATANTDKTEQYTSYHMWDLTNAADVQNNGAKPIYQERGPYVYRTFVHKDNATFSAGGSEATYRLRLTYNFVRDMSVGDDTDLIWNVNQAYVGAVATAGSEARLQIGLATAFIRRHLEFFRGPLLSALVDQAAAPALVARQAAIVRDPSVGSLDAFLRVWANGTAPPKGHEALWANMMLVDGAKAKADAEADADAAAPSASGISMAAARRLFDASLNTSLVSQLWQGAAAWGAASHEADAASQLAADFGLSAAQVAAVCDWLAAFALHQGGGPSTGGVQGQLLRKWGVASPAEMAYLQWTALVPTRGVTAADLFPSHFPPTVTPMLPAYPEYGYFLTHFFTPVPNATMSTALAMSLLNGTHGLLNVSETQDFFLHVQPPNTNLKYIEAKWGLTQGQIEGFQDFALRDLTANYARPLLSQLDVIGGGLMVNRTVSDWLFNAVDPLLAVLDPTLAHFGHFFPNNTAELPTTVYTGGRNEDQAVDANDGLAARLTGTGGKGWGSAQQRMNTLKVWRNQSEVTVWRKPQPIGGTDGTAFHFGVEPASDLATWEPDLERIIMLRNTGGEAVEVKGIKLLRFSVEQSQLLPNADYRQNISGFWNLTATHNHCPIFAGLPHFAGANESWRQQLDGMSSEGLAAYHSHVDVEPISGSTMHAQKLDQVNLYLASWHDWFPDAPGCAVCHPNMRQDVMYPMVWSNMSGTVDDADADFFKSHVYMALYARVILTTLSAVAAVGMMVAAVVFTTVWWGKERFLCFTLRPADGAGAGAGGDGYTAMRGEV